MTEDIKKTNSDGAKNAFYTIGEELFNSITHGIGSLLSIAALCVMVFFAAAEGDIWKIISASIFGATLIILYTMSTLYHAITAPRAKKIFRICDHCSIYLLIAGTYTPYTLVTLRETSGWWIFAIVWGCAVLGILLNSIDIKKYEKLSFGLYMGMGWAIVFAAKPLYDALNPIGIWLLAGGGLAYTLGVIFYKMKKIKFMHGVWHLFVFAGSLLHYFSVLFGVIL